MTLTMIYSVIISLFLINQLQEAKGSALEAPFDDVRNCPTRSSLDPSQPLYQMEVLPGIGHDNLRSIDMGQVPLLRHDFMILRHICKTTILNRLDSSQKLSYVTLVRTASLAWMLVLS